MRTAMKQENKGMLGRLLREPLFHFLILGAGLFALYANVNNDTVEPPDRIVVDEGEIQRLSEQFRRTWMRPPTRQELKGLADEFVNEEILYREALALGLDQDDLIVRRRMRQKMEFINENLFEQAAPGDAELQSYLDAHPEKFGIPEQLSFQQVYLSTKDNPEDAQDRAEELLARLEVDPALDPQAVGDPTLLPPGLSEVSARDITGVFGSYLAEAIATAPLNRWSGPYLSQYGLHVVRVTSRAPGRSPALAEVRKAVEREWTAEKRREANERFLRALRERYQIEVRLPDESTGDTVAVHSP